MRSIDLEEVSSEADRCPSLSACHVSPCGAAPRRVLGQYELCTADAKCTGNKLRARMPPNGRNCEFLRARASYSKVVARVYNKVAYLCRRRTHGLTSHEEVLFLSLPSYFSALSPPISLSLFLSYFSFLSFSLSLSFIEKFLRSSLYRHASSLFRLLSASSLSFSSLSVRYSSHSSWRYTMRGNTLFSLSLLHKRNLVLARIGKVTRDQTPRVLCTVCIRLLSCVQNGIFPRYIGQERVYERNREGGGREKAGKGKSKEEMSAVRRSSFFKCERTRERVTALCGASRDSRVSSIKRNSRKGEFHKLTVIATRFISDALLSRSRSRARLAKTSVSHREACFAAVQRKPPSGLISFIRRSRSSLPDIPYGRD